MKYECLDCGEEGFDADTCPYCGSSNTEEMDIGEYGNIDHLDEVLDDDEEEEDEESDIS